jgi:hypothetical protein
MADRSALSTPARYRIVIQGPREPRLQAWFADLEQEMLPDGRVQLSGILPDQPAPHGVLERIRDLNLVLVSVEREERVL